ncbi:hypothetical protein QEN19_001800 [Hanseniaspora menglaensis]
MIVLHFALLIIYLNLVAGYNTSLQSSLQQTFKAEPISLGSVDLSDIKDDKILLFSSLSSNYENVTIINYSGEQNFTTFNLNGENLIYYNFNNNVNISNENTTAYINLLNGQSNANITHITSLQPFDNNSFVISGTGTLNNKDLSKQIFLDLSDLSYTELFNESIISINAILFQTDTMYFGGNFKYNEKFNSIISYNFSKNSIESLPFGGFGSNSTIESIIALDNDTLLFAGNFTTLDESKYLSKTVYYQYQNVTTINETVSLNTSISSNSTDQVQQLIPLNFATWSNNDDSEFSNIDNFMCPSSDGIAYWKGKSSESTFNVNFLNSLTPSKIRLFMTSSSNSVNEFRLVMLNGGYLNLSYYDPFNNKMKSCDTSCLLYNNITDSGTVYLADNITSLSYSSYYQDFYFSPNVPLDGLQFAALNGSEMSGIQLMETEFFVYANSSLNNPGCSDVTTYSYSKLSSNTWDAGTSGSYIVTSVESQDNRSEASVELVPQINIIGDYTLNLYTPGCLADDSCSARGIVNVTVTYTDENKNELTKSQLLYQNNNEEKYDTIFSGSLYDQPTVKLKYYEPITVGNTDELVMVADRLGVIPISIPNPVNYIKTENTTTTHTTNTSVILSRNESLVINGLFEYSISNFTSKNLNSSLVVGNTTLNSFTYTNMVTNDISEFTLFSTFYNHSLIISSSSLDGIMLLTLNNANEVVSMSRLGTGGHVENAVTLEHGLQLLFGNFTLNEENLSTLYYNQSDGTFASLGSQIPANVSKNNFNTLYDNYGALIFSFDNEIYYNWTSRQIISNSSDYQLIIKNSGFNENGDTLFFGSLFNSKYSDVLKGSTFTIDSDFKLDQLNLPDEKNNQSGDYSYYTGFYINSSYTGYAMVTGNNTYSMIFIGNGSTPQLSPFSFSNKLENILYYNENGLLAFTTGTSLYLYNLTEIATINDVDLLSTTSNDINSLLYFPSDDSLLVCGNFSSLNNSTCNGTCLYDISNKKWSSLLLNKKNTIAGTLTKCLLSDNDLLYVSGNFTYKKSDYNLCAINMTTGKVKQNYDFDFDIGTVNDFQLDYNNQLIYMSTTENPETIYYQFFNETSWSNISFPSNQSIKNYISLQNINSKKRDLSGTKILAISNQGESSVYESGSWKSFFQLSDDTTSSKNLDASFFANQDISSQMVSKTISPLVVLSQNIKKLKDKTKTGFVILFGLALSTVTVSALVLAVSILLYVLGMKTKSLDTSYKMDKLFDETLESKMIRNVPPEELMKGLS